VTFPPTRDLLDRYRAGDAAAELALFERLRTQLLAKASAHPRLRTLRRHVSAEDAVHEVSWRALSSGLLTRFEDRGPGSLEAALLTILDRTLVDMGRRHGARKRGGDALVHSLDASKEFSGDSSVARTMAEALPDSATTPSVRARSNELLANCRQILSPREFEAWKLVECLEQDSVDAGRRMGVSDSSVRGLVKRAKAKLVSALGCERERDATRSRSKH
jgi:RNA polymerase sigma factor (sigma-70 family)